MSPCVVCGKPVPSPAHAYCAACESIREMSFQYFSSGMDHPALAAQDIAETLKRVPARFTRPLQAVLCGQEAARLALLLRRALEDDGIAQRCPPALFAKTFETHWQHVYLSPSASRTAAAAVWGPGAVQAGPRPAGGMEGFSEAGTPGEWDFAVGSVTGYRKWSLLLPEPDCRSGDWLTGLTGLPGTAYDHRVTRPELRGSYGKDFLTEDPQPDGRRKAACYAGSRHADVPSDAPCACGWWAYWTPGEASGHYYGGTGIPLVAAAEGSGRMIIGSRGFRSQYLKLTGVAVTGYSKKNDKQADAARKTVREVLAELLPGVPVYDSQNGLVAATGTDGTYGSAEYRYPEFWGLEPDQLAAYAYLCRKISDGLHRVRGKLAAELSDVWLSSVPGSNWVPAGPSPYAGYPPPLQEKADKCAVLERAVTALCAESDTADAVLAEKGHPEGWRGLVAGWERSPDWSFRMPALRRLPGDWDEPDQLPAPWTGRYPGQLRDRRRW